MAFNFLGKLFGDKSSRDLKQIQPIVEEINRIYPEIKNLDNDGLRAKTQEIKAYIKNAYKLEQEEIDNIRLKLETEADVHVNEKYYDRIDEIEKSIKEIIEKSLNEVLPSVFALVKETARRFSENKEISVIATENDRNIAAEHDYVQIEDEKAVWFNSWHAGGNETVWNMVHYDVQLFGGVVLHQGKIAEMTTGEGKTLVATLPVFLNALGDRGVHVVTVNDYLAKRDSEWMGPLYQFHGLTVDCIDKHQPNSDARKLAYQADITFGTNNEFGFDYLRDNMAFSPSDLVQRKHNYAIVDEVDSVLIDDARTPLIISGPTSRGSNQDQFDTLRPNVERIVNVQKNMATQLLAEAKVKLKNESDKKQMEEGALALFRSFKAMPKNRALIKYLSEQGVKAQLVKTENYYMQENSKHMHLATDMLYFVIDEKHNTIELTDKGIDLMTENIDDPTFFILPDIGSELAVIESNTTLSEEDRLTKKDDALTDYSIKTERIHTVNQLLKAYTLFEKDDEYVVVNNKVMIVDEQTGRIMDGRRYSDGLHQAIESKERLKVEASTQTMASITLQNYFRMYNKLAGMTGTAMTDAGEFWDIYKLDVVEIPTNRPIIRKDLQDKVYKTKKEKYNAVIEEINDLVDASRPVLVGTTSVEISELLSRMLNMRNIKHNVLNAKLHQREADIVAQAGLPGAVTIATNMAGRGTDIKLTQEVKDAGGLAIIGTERHDSRRVDRQLRGRSGRQGDPGSSQFYVSLEDNLMRLFSSDRIVKIMDRIGLEEGEVIQHSIISKSIERAQKKVEENNFGTRKNLLEYDDVMNSQREVIYTKRRQALMGERMGVNINNMIYDFCQSITASSHASSNYEELREELARIVSIEPPFNEDKFKKERIDPLIESVYEKASISYNRKNEHLVEMAWPVVKDVYETKSNQYKNILVPFTDGKQMYQINCNLEKAYKTHGKELIESYEKSIMLLTVDELWKEHLRELDDLRTSVQNASYEQKDPLLIYKKESFDLFMSMIEDINKRSVSRLTKGQIPNQASDNVQEAREEKKDFSKYKEQKMDLGNSNQSNTNSEKSPRTQPVRVEAKVGRNELCHCGSGLKYKKCHGKK